MNGRHYDERDIPDVARELLSTLSVQEEGATVLGLSGDLGAGKTTLVQAIARILGVRETLQSPTFVVLKRYTTGDTGLFSELVHVDAYRIDSTSELAPLHFSDILSRPKTLVIVEWPERIIEALPRSLYSVRIEHKGDSRTIFYGV